MTWNLSKVIVISLILSGCGEQGSMDTSGSKRSLKDSLGYVYTRHLMHAEDLIKRSAGNHDLKLIDFRTEEQYAKGHIKGAHQVWRPDITDTSYTYGGMIGSREQIAELLGSFGISSADTIIIYDDRAAANAARLWWILKVYGHQHMAILNGGLRAWIVAGGGLDTESVLTETVDYAFTDEGMPSLLADAKGVANANAVLLDVRSKPEYNGEVLKEGAAFAGTIEGAVNLSFDKAVNYTEHEIFHAADTLRSLFASAGVDGSKPVIVFCQSGVRSAHALFVLTELLGYENISNYDGSWIEWSHLNKSTVVTAR